MDDVLVVGSGLAGSGIATALALRGWRVRLLERQPYARHKVCGEFLSPESQDSLRALGLHRAVMALHPVAMHSATLTTPAGAELSVDLFGAAWGVSRYAMDAALLDAAAAAGVQVERGATVTGLDVTSAQASASVRNAAGVGARVARIAVVACGRNPPAALRTAPPRQQMLDRLVLAALPNRPPDVGVKCHYRGIAMPHRCELFLFEGGYIGVSPVEGGAVNACMLISQAAFTAAGASVEGAMAYAAAHNPAFARRIAGGVPVAESASAVAPVDTHRPAAPWGPTARIGDAVTMIPPLCGDGMAMALRSAEIAAPIADAVLRGELTSAAWASAHAAAWHREFAPRLRAGRALQALLARPRLAGSLLGLGRLFPPAAASVVRMTRGALPH